MTGSKSFRKKTFKVLAKIAMHLIAVASVFICIVSAAEFCGGVTEGSVFSVPVLVRCILFAAVAFLSSYAARF